MKKIIHIVLFSLIFTGSKPIWAEMDPSNEMDQALKMEIHAVNRKLLMKWQDNLEKAYMKYRNFSDQVGELDVQSNPEAPDLRYRLQQLIKVFQEKEGLFMEIEDAIKKALSALGQNTEMARNLYKDSQKMMSQVNDLQELEAQMRSDMEHRLDQAASIQ